MYDKIYKLMMRWMGILRTRRRTSSGRVCVCNYINGDHVLLIKLTLYLQVDGWEGEGKKRLGREVDEWSVTEGSDKGEGEQRIMRRGYVVSVESGVSRMKYVPSRNQKVVT